MDRPTSKMYVIGTRETGVLFLRTEPLRAATISREEIERYAEARGLTFEAAFARVAESTRHATGRLDDDDDMADVPDRLDTFRKSVERGAKISDAAFCYVAEVENQAWSARTYQSPTIERALRALDPASPASGGVTEVAMCDFGHGTPAEDGATRSGSGRIYVVGDRNSGVLFVKTEPLRAALISSAEIERYAADNGLTYDSALERIAQAARHVAAAPVGGADLCLQVKAGDGDWSSARYISGQPVGDAQLCLIGGAPGDDWSSARYISGQPVGDAQLCLIGAAPGNDWSSARWISGAAADGLVSTAAAGRASETVSKAALLDFGRGR
jgi:hypothetical protein